MPKFKVKASYIVNLEAEIISENIDTAWQAASEMDGGDFIALDQFDWSIDDVVEVLDDSKKPLG